MSWEMFTYFTCETYTTIREKCSFLQKSHTRREGSDSNMKIILSLKQNTELKLVQAGAKQTQWTHTRTNRAKTCIS